MCKFFPRKGNAWKSLYLWCLSRKKQKYAQHGHTRIVASWSPQLKRRFEFQSNQDFLRSRFERTVAYNLPPVSTFPNASATLQARYSRDCFQWERVLECIQFGLSLRSKPLLAKRSITGCFKAAQQTCTKSQTAAHGLDHVQEGRVPRVPFAAAGSGPYMGAHDLQVAKHGWALESLSPLLIRHSIPGAGHRETNGLEKLKVHRD